MSFLEKFGAPSKEEVENANNKIRRLEKMREEREEMGSKLNEREQANLDGALSIRNRHNRVFATVCGGGIALAGLGVVASTNSAKDDGDSPKLSSSVSASEPERSQFDEHVSIDPTDPDGPVINFHPVPGHLKSLQATKTCDKVDAVRFARQDIEQKFGSIISGCEGNLRSDGRTFFKCTVPGHKANAQLFLGLEKVFKEAGFVDRSTQTFAKRTFILHREDGKDGVPMGDASSPNASFTKLAKTQALPHVSHSLSSVPLSGDNLTDIKAFATEMCQTLVIPKYPKVVSKSEIICNSYGLTVGCAYSGMSYEKYAELARGSAMLMESGGEQLRFEVFSKAIYDKLRKMLASQPDILVPAK